MDLMDKLEKHFFAYTKQYDENILAIMKEKKVGIDEKVLQEILEEAKYRI